MTDKDKIAYEVETAVFNIRMRRGQRIGGDVSNYTPTQEELFAYAKESSSKELEAAKQRIAELELSALLRSREVYAHNESRKSLMLEKEILSVQVCTYRNALVKLAKLGNGDAYGNSIGNCIAIDAIETDVYKVHSDALAEKEALEKKLAMAEAASINLHKLLEVANANVVAANCNAEHFEREWYLRGDALEELTKLLAAAEQRGRDEARADNGRGFSLWFTREEWGGIIDGLGLEIDRSGQRKSANSESTSDVTSTMCERVIAAIMNASEIHPTAPKVKP